VYTVCTNKLSHIQVWRKRTQGTGWELVDSPGNGDEKAEVQDYVKRQDQHTQSMVRQRHSIAIKQITIIFSRLSDDVVSHEQYLSGIVRRFKADPSAGASQVCPSIIFSSSTCLPVVPVFVNNAQALSPSVSSNIWPGSGCCTCPMFVSKRSLVRGNMAICYLIELRDN
jgi:hypothetical protein